MGILSMKVPIRKMSGNLSYAPHICNKQVLDLALKNLSELRCRTTQPINN